MLGQLAHNCLKLLDPERAHNIAKWGMKRRWFSPGPTVIGNSWTPPARLFGVPINNRLGLAAGFDKNGELVDAVEDYGFGFIEVGSVTYRGGKGNPKPRMFRVKGDHAIVNRMGLNGEPAHVVAERLRDAAAYNYGINLAKTHDPDIVGDKAIMDIVESYKLLYTFGAYVCFNISCPNTKEGKTFEDPGALRELLSAIKEFNPRGFRSHLVKFSPNLVGDKTRFCDLLDVCRDFDIAGYVFCNTLPKDFGGIGGIPGRGGLSGKEVKLRAKLLIEWARQIEKIKEPIIACGGIFTGMDMFDYDRAGADFFQAYCGFVRGPNSGPKFARRILDQFQIHQAAYKVV